MTAAATRRLNEEFGFTTALETVRTLVYRAHDEASGLTEHELLHVLVGRFDGTPVPDPDEIGDWQWIAPEPLRREVSTTPERFTPWFRMLVEQGLLDREQA